MKIRGFEIVSEYKEKNIHIPVRKTSLSAGYDIEAADDVLLLPHTVGIIPTGLKAYMQPDEYLGIHIRSGISIKHNLSLPNSQGIIDADYYNNPSNEGHILIAIVNHGDQPFAVNKGLRIAQAIFYRYLVTDYDDAVTHEPRTGGLGSTGY